MSHPAIFCLFLLLCTCSVSAVANILDLSYQFHLTSSAIAAHSKRFLHNLVENGSVDGAENCTVVIDTSNSNLGDEGLDQIISSIVESSRIQFANSSMNLEIDFKAQMNGLTSQGIATFLNRILNSNVSTLPNATSSDWSFVPIKWRSLDFGWNPLYNSASVVSHKPFHIALHNVFAGGFDGFMGLEALCLSCTGLGPTTCRILAKGLLRRFERAGDNRKINNTITPMSLHLSCNRDVGDAGAAAFAALIRSVVCHENESPILDTLDLSACDIGDVGVEALALALEDASASVMIRKLVLCHNRISDQGAISLGRALHRNIRRGEMHIDLSDNPLISDQGVSTLLSAVEKGCVTSLSLRSCSIQADGTELVGKTLRTIALNKEQHGRSLSIDLSGNPIGILRGKTEKKNSYSASALKSKASATASAYVSQGLSFLKRGFGGVGGSSGVESDDEEEKQQSTPRSSVSDSKNMRCGFKSLANAFMGSDSHDASASYADESSKKRINLGLRRTFCDTAGADALAAMLISTKDHFKGVELKLELDLNPVVEEDVIYALHGSDDDLLVEMADRHMEAMEILRLSHERAIAATTAMAARRKISSNFNSGRYDTDYHPQDFTNVYEPVLDEDTNIQDSDADYESIADY